MMRTGLSGNASAMPATISAQQPSSSCLIKPFMRCLSVLISRQRRFAPVRAFT
jgi:hypothetical protein